MYSNTELVHYLIDTTVLKTKHLIEACKKVDRRDFVLSEYEFDSYSDIPLPIGYGQTISQPTTVIFMLELLGVQSGENVLDIGSGSGWTTALLAFLVGEKGMVKGYELIPELVQFGKENLQKYHFKHASIHQSRENFSFIKGKYDKILVSASTSKIPKELIKKLKVGGSMVIPIHDSIYKATKIDDEGNLHIEKYYGFVFVPLLVE